MELHLVEVIFLCFGLVVYFDCNTTDAAVASFSDPGCEGDGVCSSDPLTFTCEINGAVSLRVVLPDGEQSVVSVGSDPDDVVLSDGFEAVELNIAENPDDSSRNFTLTLSVARASLLDGSEIKCDDTTDDNVDMAGCPILGNPDPPTDLSYDNSVIIGDTVALQWSSPTYTGGGEVTVMEYRVTANDQTETVISSDEMVTYTSSGLIYGDVQVTAINSCGHESDSANVNISASAPTNVSELSVELYCDVPLKHGRPVTLNWIYEPQEIGVVYPEVSDVNAKLEPRNFDCPVINNNCTVNITKDDNYIASIHQMNGIGSTVYQEEFESMPLEQMVVPSERMLTVTLTVQMNCRSANYTIVVVFGVQDRDGDNCDLSHVMTVTDVLPGNPRMFTVNCDILELGAGQEYCYNGSLIGDAGIILDEVSGSGGGGGGLSDEAIIGISSAGLVVSGFIVVIVLILCRLKKKKNNNEDQEMKELRPTPGPGSPLAAESGEGVPTYQDPNTISHTPHPSTGEVYTDVSLDKKTKKKKTTEQVEAGPTYQDPSTIEHPETPSGDLYAMPQQGKKGKKGKKEEKELTEEQKAAQILYSVPDRKGQSEGLTYAELSNSQAPPSKGSTYADIKPNN